MLVWIRIGLEGDYQAVYDLNAAVDNFACWHVGEVTGWVNGGGGFETLFLHGDDYISLYWGDEKGNLIRPLTISEQEYVEVELQKTAEGGLVE